ncbi:hypothetical protein NHX12_020837, partial [Muraenolepis orangiensis]
MELPVGPSSFDFDLLVIGAGSGGQAVSKEAVGFQKRVLVVDPVSPTSEGSTSVLGWSSVTMATVRKLLHQASLLGQAIRDSQKFGWTFNETGLSHSWTELRGALVTHAESAVLEVRRDLTDRGVTYLRARVELVTDTGGRKSRLSAETLVVDPGEGRGYPGEARGYPGEGRGYPGVPGDRELCVTSDELFFRPRPPGRTLVVGGSPEALECAGFLSGLGHEVTVTLPTSDPLPGFDRKMTQKIENHMLVELMEAHDKDVPAAPVPPGRLRVSLVCTAGHTTQDHFHTQRRLYGGLTSTERANATFGETNIEVYHSFYWPLEWTVPGRDKNSCYLKVLCHIPDQGFSAAMTCGLTKRQLDATAPLRPASAQ